MYKTQYIPIPEDDTIRCKVNKAIDKSRLSGILFAPANSKLYFEVLKIISAPQNNLPLKRGGKYSKVAFPSKKNNHH